MLPRRTLLAVAAVLDVARLGRANPLPAKSLAARHDLAPRQFETLLQALVRADILKSLRGPHGGYALARERRRISLGDIARALEPAKARAAASRSGKAGLLEAVVIPAVNQATAAFLQKLDATSLEALYRQAEHLDIAVGSPVEGDFNI